MSLQDYADYQASPQIANNPQSSLTSPNSFSVAWTGHANAMGVKPPNPQFKPANSPNYILAPTMVPAPYLVGSYPNGLIQSRREPYAVEWTTNPYGQLNTRLGTSMGS